MAVTMTNLHARAAGRASPPANRVGLTHVDHTAVSARRPEESAQFYVQVLGAALHVMHGFSPEERAVGRARHLFLSMGDSRFQLGTSKREQDYADPDNPNDSPHWAFGAPPEVLAAMCERLAAHRIPFDGPRAHPDSEAVSVYFKDPDANKLEVVSWGASASEPPAAAAARIDWRRLNHAWRAVGGGLWPRSFHSSFHTWEAPNLYGLSGLDHVALPSRHPEETAEFYRQVLGGELFASRGFTPADRAAGPGRQVWLHMGRTLLRLAFPSDGASFPDVAYGGWNHWSFGASAEVFEQMRLRLLAEGVPLSGPWRHMKSDATSMYFADPEGNHLEICTGEPYPEEKTRLAGRDGGPEYLPHDWRADR